MKVTLCLIGHYLTTRNQHKLNQIVKTKTRSRHQHSIHTALAIIQTLMRWHSVITKIGFNNHDVPFASLFLMWVQRTQIRFLSFDRPADAMLPSIVYFHYYFLSGELHSIHCVAFHWEKIKYLIYIWEFAMSIN